MELIKCGIIAKFCAAMAMIAGLSSCNGMIYDEQGDCDPYYKVKFVYDTNLKFTDAFPAEVSAVTLYLLDPETDRVVWQKTESGEALAQEGYMMDVDVEPGNYTLLAWCGEGHQTSFKVSDATVGKNLQCRLDDRQPVSMCATNSNVCSTACRPMWSLRTSRAYTSRQCV